MSSTAGLPNELLDMIFGETDEVETLAACSLVCRGWTEPARRQLFATISVRRADNFDDFLAFIRTHPHVAAHIQALYLEGLDAEPRSGSNKTCAHIDPRTLASIANSIPKRKVLELTRVRVIDSSQADSNTSPFEDAEPIAIDDLVIGKRPDYRHSFAAIVQTLRLFNTKFLQVDMTAKYHWPADSETVPASTFRGLTRPLQHPWICWKGIGRGPAPFLFLRDNLQYLSEVHLGFYVWRHIPEIGQMLLHFSNTITTFTISSNPNGMYDKLNRNITHEDLVPLSLSSLKHLSFLRFDLDEPLLSYNYRKSLCWTDSVGIPTLLSFFPHDLPLTRGVHIDVMVAQKRHGVPLHMHDRSEVEDALLRFNNLSDVTLVVHNLYKGEEYARAACTTAFPRLCEMNKLSITFDLDSELACC